MNRWLMSMARWRPVLWLVGVGAFVAGYSSHSAALDVPGAAAVVISCFGLPFGSEACRNRIVRIQRHYAAAVREATQALELARSESLGALESVSVPPSFAAAHRRLLELERDRAVTIKGPLGERTRRSVELRLAAEAQLLELHEQAHAAQERAFVGSVDQYRARDERARATMADEVRRAMSETISRLERLRVPSKLSGLYAEFCREWRDLFIASTSHDQAIHEGDLDAALAAAAGLEAIADRMRESQSALDRTIYRRQRPKVRVDLRSS